MGRSARIEGFVSASVDRVVHAAAISRSRRSRRRSRSESLGPRERIEALSALSAQYASSRYFEQPDLFFPPPLAVAPREVRSRRLSGGTSTDVIWSSRFEPFHTDVAPRYLRHVRNRWAAARWLKHDGAPCGTVLFIHGYLAGTYAFEERIWPVDRFFRHGLDVALPTLPFHGVRGGLRRPPFPGSDPRFTIEGFRQTILDLRTLVDLVCEAGRGPVAVVGMSLGGYATALLAGVDPRVSVAVPYLPLASIADFARDDRRLVGTTAEQAEQYRLLEGVYRVVSPLARPPLVPAKGRLVIAAERDAITPVTHARRIAEHFQCELHLVRGGHILQLGRSDAFQRLEELFEACGMWQAPPRV